MKSNLEIYQNYIDGLDNEKKQVALDAIALMDNIDIAYVTLESIITSGRPDNFLAMKVGMKGVSSGIDALVKKYKVEQ